MASKRLVKKRSRMMEKKLKGTHISVTTREDVTVALTEQVPVEETIMNTPESQVELPVSEPEDKQKTGKAKGKNMKSRFFVQYQGHEFEEQDVLAKIKQEWKDQGNMIKDLKELDIYAKPEEGKVYYTINGNISGNISMF